MITIKITTSAVPPIPLKAFIDNLENNDFDIHFNPYAGYEHQFNLPKGEYVFSVSGMNGLREKDGKDILGTTKVYLDGQFSIDPEPASPLKSSDEFFILAYRFTI